MAISILVAIMFIKLLLTSITCRWRGRRMKGAVRVRRPLKNQTVKLCHYEFLLSDEVNQCGATDGMFPTSFGVVSHNHPTKRKLFSSLRPQLGLRWFSFPSGPFTDSLQQLLPVFVTTKRQLFGNGVQRNVHTGEKGCLLEADRPGELNPWPSQLQGSASVSLQTVWRQLCRAREAESEVVLTPHKLIFCLNSFSPSNIILILS